jgi:hypothetical protein
MKRMVFLILLLGIGLSVATLRVVIPADCQRLCMEPEQAPCPRGSCRGGEQKAGFPLPVIYDSGAGGSPISGWGKVGPEDLPNLLTFLINVAVYGALLGFIWLGFLAVRRKIHSSVLLRWSPLFGLALVIMVLGISRFRTSPVQKLAAGGSPETAILGNWTAQDPVSGDEVVFRFYQTGRLSIGDAGWGGSFGGEGEYQWVGDGALRMVIGPVRTGPDPCTSMVTFLKDYCRTTIVDPVSYPGPEVIPDPAYPVPSPQPVEFSQIDEVLQAEIAGGDRLTLAHPSGGSLTLQRVTGD